MCNDVMPDANKKISPTGLGYKVFRRQSNNKLHPANQWVNTPTTGYKENKDGWVEWLDKYTYGDGFCIFRYKKDAVAYTKSFLFTSREKLIVARVLYAEALGSQSGIFDMRVIIAKEFLLPEYVEGEYV